MRRKNRGYWVSRQAYALGDPCFRAVEIAYSSDKSKPRENASPDELVGSYRAEGYHDYPIAAVEAAKEVWRLWSREFPAEEGDEDAAIRFTVTTGGGAFTPETMTLEELEDWAAKRYNGMKREEVKPAPLPPDMAADLARFRSLEDEHVRLVIEPDDLPYDDSFFDSWEVCEEEVEELKDDLWRQIDREGVWVISAEVCRKGCWEQVGTSCAGFIGPIEDAEKIEFVRDALHAYDKMMEEKAERKARKHARRATYAGPSDE